MGASHAHPSGFGDRYELLGKLGTGSFGEVRAALSLNPAGGVKAVVPPRQRAVKIISLVPKRARQKGDGAAHVDEGILRAAKQEAKLWSKVGKHPHCIELLRTFYQDGLFMMVAEKADASVMERLRQVRELPMQGLLRVVREMLLGVAYCHKRRIVHRDIKPDNFLLSGDDVGSATVKLCDFGLAARLPLAGGQQLFGTHGTAPYMSMEMIMNKGHDTSTDVWSLGVTAYVLLYGDFPYRPRTLNNSAMKQAIVTGIPRPCFRSLSSGGGAAGCYSWDAQQLVDVTKHMMEREYYRRCTATEALGQLPSCEGRLRLASTSSYSLPSDADSPCACPHSP